MNPSPITYPWDTHTKLLLLLLLQRTGSEKIGAPKYEIVNHSALRGATLFYIFTQEAAAAAAHKKMPGTIPCCGSGAGQKVPSRPESTDQLQPRILTRIYCRKMIIY